MKDFHNSHETPTLAQCLAQAHALGMARLDAQMLLLHSLERPLHERAWLLANDTNLLSPAQLAAWNVALQRRLASEPVAYITGRKEFFGLTLAVDARVLDPRPDTETLVDWGLAVLPVSTSSATDSMPENSEPLRLLDLGTGSGAIALALQFARPDAHVWAVDVSESALVVARANAAQLKLPVKFIASDWFDRVSGVFDLIVSNPPYIADADPHLTALRHEPLQALTSGPDGLADLRRIVTGSLAHLASSGWLLLEHGFDQADTVRALLTQAGYTHVQSHNDLAGLARCSGGQKPPK
jgi:release factor glutamine methyltransferase